MYHSRLLAAEDRRPLPIAVPPPSPGTLDDLERATANDVVLARGDHLFTAGQTGGGAFTVLSGALVLCRSLPDGRRQIVDLVGPGRLVGLAEGVVRASTATALVRTRLRPLRRPSPEAIAAELATCLARHHAHAVLLGRKTALEKVASALLELAALFGSRWPEETIDGPSFVLPMTRSDLGDWLGLVIETVSRALGELQRRGLVVIERTDVVHLVDPAGLAALSGDRLVRRADLA
ncbi:Crp/Fnr family transcriptional regulator [Oharaeibacter diazotrophicus]|uniref:Crp/Fnr family transcriptional regulator n=2 Tax=Oharaeibacter diazotrophicus TaxID=1920512 RepID=A0A4R6RL58_9HYPH|nr:Crp/Fnr family transcriptional regulator [Oharaeibacter diazotrophicus]TDP87244.1 Crp/Fnr family transcriptional regulator [Oharaeibacter diazotrophicus]BBE70813.1 nitrogen fixation regulation protein FixK [Pleomorphomonas sp. SM30]GLS77562.1 Crp/Fnr family transcriptional regulator [Oharaeibacter diazotrophicus]